MRALLIVMVWLCFTLPALAQDAKHGTFKGNIVTLWLDKDHRRMQLTEDFQYIAPDDTTWDAPAGWIVDGASIPQWAWSIIGSPFEGAYRKASVIHDVACDRRERPWKAVHRAFYTAMLAAGTDPIKARIMYAAVYYGGPRWSSEYRLSLARDTTPSNAKMLVTHRIGAEPDQVEFVDAVDDPDREVTLALFSPDDVPTMSETEFKALATAIQRDNLSIDDIEAYKQ